ncbi:MAG: ATP-binding protein [Ferruginibacter sp.]
MPASNTAQPPNTSSFIGLQSYTEEQADNFFGRDKEIESLTKLVESNTLTIVFGKSGTGKTSLLNAGVFPNLRKDYCLPFRIRLEFRDDSLDLITQIKNVLQQEIDKYGFSVEAYPGGETLWEYFHREPLWNAVTPILVFDQFEEIFTLAKKNERFGIKEQAIFWEELADLIENSIPEKLKEQFLNNKEEIHYNYRTQKTKILFSFREEFLPEFESITSKIPSIKFSRFRLLPMNGHQAYEVITRTWKDDINPTEARQVVSFFTYDNENESYDLITVEPALLSQVCSYIDKERIKEGAEKVSAELLKKYPKDTILRSIYEEGIEEGNEALNRYGQAVEKLARNPVKEFVEEKMITTEGYRTKYSLSENDVYIRPGVEVLINRYLIREDDNKLELTHDILAPIIKTDREKRRKEIAFATERKKARRKAFVILLAALLTGGGFWAFATIQRNNAIQERDDAIVERNDTQQQTDSLQRQFTLDSIKLSQLKKGIKSRSFPQDDTSMNFLNELYIKDSTELVNLKSNYSGLAEALKAKTYMLDSMRILFDKTSLEYLNSSTLSASNYREAMNTMLKLRSRIGNDSMDLVSTNRKLTDLTIRFNNLNDLYEALLQLRYPRPVAVDTNFNVKLDLYFVSSKKNLRKAPSNLTIFLIPDSIANKKIIRQAKLYEIHCDDNTLRKTSNFKVATYYNGRYGFVGVPEGKYFIKICTYYGGYYTLTKTSAAMQEIKWEASPPIR